MRNLMLKRKKAFTLVEIMVVIVVIGLLFMFFVPRIDFAGDKARETGVKTDFRAFMLAAEQVMRENSGLGFVTSATVDTATSNIYYINTRRNKDGSLNGDVFKFLK